MTLKEKIKNLFTRTKRQVLSRKVGTFNGYCPECHDHIGAFINLVLGTRIVKCGNCNHIFEVNEDGRVKS